MNQGYANCQIAHLAYELARRRKIISDDKLGMYHLDNIGTDLYHTIFCAKLAGVVWFFDHKEGYPMEIEDIEGYIFLRFYSMWDIRNSL